MAPDAGRDAGRAARPFGNCTVVGASSTLRGSRLGRFIDAHNTVIRENRLALNGSDGHDIGRRTDVLFTTLCNVKPNKTLWVPIAGRPTSEQAHVNCSLHTGAGCAFRQVVLRGPPKCSNFVRRLGATKESWARLSVPVLVSSEGLVRDIEEMLRLAAGQRYIQASTGFHAVLTMALRCDALTAIGFDGDGATYDGHETTHEHMLSLEHMLLRLLQRGSVGGVPRGWAHTRLHLHALSTSAVRSHLVS